VLGHVVFAEVGYDKMQQGISTIRKTIQIIPFQAGCTWGKISSVLQELLPTKRFPQFLKFADCAELCSVARKGI
jgi:hypothetical protein